MWIFYAIIYAFLLGFYKILKKKNVQCSSPLAALAIMTTTTFVCVFWRIEEAIQINPEYLWLTVVKGVIVVLAWSTMLTCIKHIEFSKTAIIQNFSLVISFICGILIFKENVSGLQIAGACIVLVGVIFVGISIKSERKRTNIFYILLTFFSACCTAASAVLDKYITNLISAGQLQFWCMLFAVLFCWIILGVVGIKTKKAFINKTDLKNYWIYISGAVLAIADSILYFTYKIEGSKLSVISVIANFSTIIAVVGGILVYKEKNIWWKIAFSLLVFAGELMVVLG